MCLGAGSLAPVFRVLFGRKLASLNSASKGEPHVPNWRQLRHGMQWPLLGNTFPRGRWNAIGQPFHNILAFSEAAARTVQATRFHKVTIPLYELFCSKPTIFTVQTKKIIKWITFLQKNICILFRNTNPLYDFSCFSCKNCWF